MRTDFLFVTIFLFSFFGNFTQKCFVGVFDKTKMEDQFSFQKFTFSWSAPLAAQPLWHSHWIQACFFCGQNLAFSFFLPKRFFLTRILILTVPNNVFLCLVAKWNLLIWSKGAGKGQLDFCFLLLLQKLDKLELGKMCLVTVRLHRCFCCCCRPFLAASCTFYTMGPSLLGPILLVFFYLGKIKVHRHRCGAPRITRTERTPTAADRRPFPQRQQTKKKSPKQNVMNQWEKQKSYLIEIKKTKKKNNTKFNQNHWCPLIFLTSLPRINSDVFNLIKLKIAIFSTWLFLIPFSSFVSILPFFAWFTLIFFLPKWKFFLFQPNAYISTTEYIFSQLRPFWYWTFTQIHTHNRIKPAHLAWHWNGIAGILYRILESA